MKKDNKVLEQLKSKIEDLNSALGFKGDMSDVGIYRQIITSNIRTPHKTSLSVTFKAKELQQFLDHANDEDLSVYVMNKYLTSLERLDENGDLRVRHINTPWANELLKQKGITYGHILAITDKEIEYFKKQIYIYQYLIGVSDSENFS